MKTLVALHVQWRFTRSCYRSRYDVTLIPPHDGLHQTKFCEFRNTTGPSQ